MNVRKEYIELAKYLIHSIYTLRELMSKFEKDKEGIHYICAEKNFLVNLYVIGPCLDNLLKLEELKDYHEDLRTMREQFKHINKECNEIKLSMGLIAST